MRLTENQIRRIIREEHQRVLNEGIFQKFVGWIQKSSGNLVMKGLEAIEKKVDDIVKSDDFDEKLTQLERMHCAWEVSCQKTARAWGEKLGLDKSEHWKREMDRTDKALAEWSKKVNDPNYSTVGALSADEA